jgi:hypothetical protein
MVTCSRLLKYVVNGAMKLTCSRSWGLDYLIIVPPPSRRFLRGSETHQVGFAGRVFDIRTIKTPASSALKSSFVRLELLQIVCKYPVLSLHVVLTTLCVSLTTNM